LSQEIFKDVNSDNPKKNKINVQGIIRGVFSLTTLNYIILFFDVLIVFYASSFQIDLESMGVYNSVLQYVPIISLLVVFGFKNTSNKFITQYDTQNEQNKSAAVVYFITIFNCVIAFLFSGIFLMFPAFFSNLLTQSPDYTQFIELQAINLLFIPIVVFNHFLF